jgi:hypothetical protein
MDAEPLQALHQTHEADKRSWLAEMIGRLALIREDLRNMLALQVRALVAYTQSHWASRSARSKEDTVNPKRTIVAVGAVCLALLLPPAIVCAQDVMISEVDYDQPGTDSNEWIEIVNTSQVEIETQGLSLVLYNGDLSGSCNVYCTVDLTALGSFLPQQQYIVIGNHPCASLPLCNSTDAIQNGSPDAIAILWHGILIDSVEYGSDLAHGVCNFDQTLVHDSNTVEGSIQTCFPRPPGARWTFTHASTPCADNNCTATDVPFFPRMRWGRVKSLYR